MEATDVDATLARLRRIEGQVRGLQKMLTDGRACDEMFTQLMAVRSGLEAVSLLILDDHVRGCVLDGTTVDAEKLDELSQTLRWWSRFGAPAAQMPD